MSDDIPPQDHCPMCGEQFTGKIERCPACGEKLNGSEVDEAFWIDPKLIRLYHTQTRWLSGMWIFIGAFPTVISLASLLSDTLWWVEGLFYLMGFGIGITFIIIGLAIRSKREWSTWVSLIVSYLVFLGSLLLAQLCGGFLIVIILIIQSHTVMGSIKRLKKLGIPLDIPIPK